MQDFRKLQVWEKSHRLTLQVYRETTAFPVEERFGLSSQLRRGASSIAANLAEGSGRSSPRDKARFFAIAMGSASEVHYYFILARDLSYLSEDQYRQMEVQIIEIKKMLTALIRKLTAEPCNLTTDH